MWKEMLTMAVVTAGLVNVGFAQDIQVKVDGENLHFADQKPIILEGRTLVPLRSVFEAIGASVEWNGETRTITAKKRFEVVNLKIDSKDLYKNGIKVTEMTVPAQIVNGRTMVPARYVAEAFDASVKWDGVASLVTIETMQGTHKIDDVHCVEVVKNSGKTAVNIKYSYPIIENDGNSTVIESINQKLKEYAENWVTNVKHEVEEKQLIMLAENEEKVFEYELAFDITSDEEGLLSVVYRCVSTTGGAHPNFWKDTKVFSFETGELLGVDKIFNMSEEMVMYSIRRFYEVEIEETPEKFYENAKELIGEAMNNVKYYVTENRVVFFLNPYEIAPYASGEIEIITERPIK